MFIDNFVPSIDETELKNKTMKMVTVTGKHVLLARIDNEIYGISHICPCMQCDLSLGKLNGYVVSCPCHGWKFDVRTGVYLKTKQKLLTTYRCKIDNGKIHIEIF